MRAQRSVSTHGCWRWGLTLLASLALSACATMTAMPPGPQYMVVGIDNKVTWDEDGKVRPLPPGKDAVADRRHRHRPRAPEDRGQPAADELDLRPADQPGHHARRPARAGGQLDGLGAGRCRLEGGARQQALRHRPHDQPAAPDRHGGGAASSPRACRSTRRQPGADRQPRRQLDQRALASQGKQVKLVDTVAMGEQVAHVAFTPDGKRALAGQVPRAQGRAAERSTARRSPTTSTTCRWACGPTTSTSRPTASSRSPPTTATPAAPTATSTPVGVIDLEASPPRVIDKVVVGDAPEGFAISPTGKLAVAVLLRGSDDVRRARASTTATAASRCSRSTARRSPRSARSRCAACPRARCSAPTAATSTSATSSTRPLDAAGGRRPTVTDTGTLQAAGPAGVDARPRPLGRPPGSCAPALDAIIINHPFS